MSQLILSEDTTIELDGRELSLKKGSKITVNRNENVYKVDEGFEVATDQGKILVEAGDVINLNEDGMYVAGSDVKFMSEGKMFALEKGDRFGVIEEGFWGELWSGFKHGFTGKQRAQAASGMGTGFQRVVRVVMLARDGLETTEPKKAKLLDKVIKTVQFKTISRAAQLSDDPEQMSDWMAAGQMDDPFKAVDLVRRALIRIGFQKIASHIDEIIPPGKVSQLGRIWDALTGGEDPVLQRQQTIIGLTSSGEKYELDADEATGPVEIKDGETAQTQETRAFKKVGKDTYVDDKKNKIIIVKKSKLSSKTGEMVGPKDEATAEPKAEPKAGPPKVEAVKSKEMVQALLKSGYSQKQIDDLTPADAARMIKAETGTKKTDNSGQMVAKWLGEAIKKYPGEAGKITPEAYKAILTQVRKTYPKARQTDEELVQLINKIAIKTKAIAA